MAQGEIITISGGFILLARRIIESEIWRKPPLYLKVWVYLLAKAQHKPFKDMGKGQLFIKIPDVQEECAWFVGCRKVVPSKDQIFQVIDWLRRCVGNAESVSKATMITTTKATHGMLVTINNYAVYQNPRFYESNAQSNAAPPSKATPEPNNINKNDTITDKKKETIFREIIDFLNATCKTGYKLVEGNKRHINARLTDGYTVDNFQTVITKKAREWLGTDREKYLRPETLFGPKFDSYLNQLEGGHDHGADRRRPGAYDGQNSGPAIPSRVRKAGEE